MAENKSEIGRITHQIRALHRATSNDRIRYLLAMRPGSEKPPKQTRSREIGSGLAKISEETPSDRRGAPLSVAGRVGTIGVRLLQPPRVRSRTDGY